MAIAHDLSARTRARRERRRICYVTGTRADFGLMRRTLQAIVRSVRLELRVVVTGMHLSAKYGNTAAEVAAAGVPIAARVRVPLTPETGATMARGIGRMIGAFVAVFERERPDVVLLLGDRGEMLAAAVAAIHLNLPVAHIHGGERSGTVDEPVRHAISKLAHLHLVATTDAKRRLVRMGERASHIWVTGAPGLDGIAEIPRRSRQELFGAVGMRADRPTALFVHHPVLQDATAAGREADQILAALERIGVQVLALQPNADAGSHAIRQVIAARAKAGLHAVRHLPRDEFINWLSTVDVLVGNSSSGIIEAASFGTPVVNIGSRQNFRFRNRNVIDVSGSGLQVERAVRLALRHGRYACRNRYGDGQASLRIVRILENVALDRGLLAKTNAY